MPWHRNEPDPLEARRRELAEQQRLLGEKMSRLTEELQHGPRPTEPVRKANEPPIWRMEDDPHHPRPIEPTSARKRNLARQRQRDRFLLFIYILLLLLVLGGVIWVWKTHVTE